MSTDIVFLDTETLGLDRLAPVWEFAAVRVTSDGRELARDMFQIKHEPGRFLETLDEWFRRDYEARYDEASVIYPWDAVPRIDKITQDRAVVAGSNPGFDVERLELLMRHYGTEPSWHYHPKDIANLVEGFLAACQELPDPPFKSDGLSKALGIDPADFARHSAMGDVEWTLAQWRHVMHDVFASSGRSL